MAFLLFVVARYSNLLEEALYNLIAVDADYIHIVNKRLEVKVVGRNKGSWSWRHIQIVTCKDLLHNLIRVTMAVARIHVVLPPL